MLKKFATLTLPMLQCINQEKFKKNTHLISKTNKFCRVEPVTALFLGKPLAKVLKELIHCANRIWENVHLTSKLL